MFNGSGAQPMEIVNLQGNPQSRDKSFKCQKRGKLSAKNSQRAEDIANSTCFVHHKKGVRASILYNGNGSVSNNNTQTKKECFVYVCF